MLKRTTIVSSKVMEMLDASAHPLSVANIMNRLQQEGLTPNKTTIYRILDKLLATQTISVIMTNNGVSYYEPSGTHHHHFICNACQTVFCLTACHIDVHNINLSALLPNPSFTIESHDFNLYGTCAPCETGSQAS
tara:strand:- start:883 stop:1287 length:405 start_codon:yes stop_codon:yes gene_type:complete